VSRYESPNGAIIGTRTVVLAQLTPAPGETTIISEEWKGALSIYLNAAGIQIGIQNFLSFRVYAKTGGTRALIRQFLYQPRFPEPAPGVPGMTSDPQSGKRDVLIGRVSGFDCEEVEVTVCIPQAYPPTDKEYFVVTYAMSSSPPGGAPYDDMFMRRFVRWPLIPPAGPIDTTAYRLTQIHGTLHQLWAVNRAATDVWLYLFDDGTFNPGWAGNPPPNGSYPRITPMYLPPNGKGVTSLDFGRAGLMALWAIQVAASSSPTTFTYDAAANIAVTAELS
jgi:hypothetical protein